MTQAQLVTVLTDLSCSVPRSPAPALMFLRVMPIGLVKIKPEAWETRVLESFVMTEV